MNFATRLQHDLTELDCRAALAPEPLERLKTELSFAASLARAHPEQQAQWEELIARAVPACKVVLAGGGSAQEAVAAAEEVLLPLKSAAKAYTIHCVGHAHIDMNWQWNWPETVAITNDTFTTVDRLMDEFPDFRFSQSQASVYQIMKEYLPELYARVRKRVAEGRWEITASQWVEGDKNLASGESLCRHLLYTRQFFKAEFGLSAAAVPIAWEPDTFGHAHTLPGILVRGGVRRYYFHRGGAGPVLFWWQSPDGSRVLAFDDRRRGYNGILGSPAMLHGLFAFQQATGLKDYLFVYGVGDHGGGPTRADLIKAEELKSWPIFPTVKLSTADAFFGVAEKQAGQLPVVNAELNFVLEGCYTSQSNIKRANRASENALVEAEVAALLGKGLARQPYPEAALTESWRNALFNQFHDILPGAGVRETYQHAQGLFQEILARTSMLKTRALRALAAQVDTTASCLEATLAPQAVPVKTPGAGVSAGLGAGPGCLDRAGAVSRAGLGSVCCDSFVVFNLNPWPRTELVRAYIWDRSIPDGQLVVKDEAGQLFRAQVLNRREYWRHDGVTVVFPARDVPGLGYRSYSVGRGVPPPLTGGCCGDSAGTIENEFLKVQVEPGSGALLHLLDKRTGVDLVAPGSRLGRLEYFLENPHPMTAWVLGQIVEHEPLDTGAVLDGSATGPHWAAVVVSRKFRQSSLKLEISLSAGVPRVDFNLELDWLERGGPGLGVPLLKAAFPLGLREPRARYECAHGHVVRPVQGPLSSLTYDSIKEYFPSDAVLDRNPGEVPAHNWVDITGKSEQTGATAGFTLLNDSKYGYSVKDNTLYMTLLRSSYDPDPLPELGRHTIRWALEPHGANWTPAEATRAGRDFNQPLNVVHTTRQRGKLPSRHSFGEILTPNVMLSGLKKAEHSNALIVRLYEMNGRAATARVRLGEAFMRAQATAAETDLLERPLKQSSAKIEKGVLSVKLPAFGLATVKIK